MVMNVLRLSFLISQAPVAHACNPNYSGGRDQEALGSKPAWANNSKRPFHRNRAGGVAQGEGPEFKPWYCKKNKKQQNNP
jgi:hypothetical protein